MAKSSNGKAKRGKGANNQCNSEDAGEGLASVTHQGSGGGNDADTTSNADSTWRNSNGQDSAEGYREGNLGGIVSQLRELRDQHLAFVDAHTERLKARLADDEQHRKEIIEKMNQLECQIREYFGADIDDADI